MTKPNQENSDIASEQKYFRQPGGFDTPLGPEPECFTARRLATLAEFGMRPRDKQHIAECDPCLTALGAFLQSEHKLVMFVPEPYVCGAGPARMLVEIFGTPELINALNVSTLRMQGPVASATPRRQERKAAASCGAWLGVEFNDIQVSGDIQSQFAKHSYPEMVEPFTILGALADGSTIRSKGEIVLKQVAAAG
jgi:hypothetical protein